MTDTAALREAAEKATPGPWRAETKHNFSNGYIYTAVLPVTPDPETMRHLEMASGEFHVCRMTHTPVPEKADLYRRDSEFIALANPVTILSLLDELDRLRASPAPDRVSVTDEMVTRGCEKACWLAEPYTAPREGGVPIECDISEADAEEINRLARREMRAILEAALSEASK